MNFSGNVRSCSERCAAPCGFQRIGQCLSVGKCDARRAPAMRGWRPNCCGPGTGVRRTCAQVHGQVARRQHRWDAGADANMRSWYREPADRATGEYRRARRAAKDRGHHKDRTRGKRLGIGHHGRTLPGYLFVITVVRRYQGTIVVRPPYR